MEIISQIINEWTLHQAYYNKYYNMIFNTKNSILLKVTIARNKKTVMELFPCFTYDNNFQIDHVDRFMHPDWAITVFQEHFNHLQKHVLGHPINQSAFGFHFPPSAGWTCCPVTYVRHKHLNLSGMFRQVNLLSMMHKNPKSLHETCSTGNTP